MYSKFEGAIRSERCDRGGCRIDVEAFMLLTQVTKALVSLFALHKKTIFFEENQLVLIHFKFARVSLVENKCVV